MDSCKGTTEGVDQNALDTCWRINEHAILEGTLYRPIGGKRHYDGRCLKCGLYVHVHDFEIVDSYD